MSDNLAELSRRFLQLPEPAATQARKEIEAAESFASYLLNKEKRDEESRVAPFAGAIAVFEAYRNALFKLTDFTLPDSVVRVVEELKTASEGVLSKFERPEWRAAITASHREAETWAWTYHIALDQRKGVDIINVAMERHGLNSPQLAKRVQSWLRRRKPKVKYKADKSTVHRLMIGETKRPDPGLLKAIIEVLELSPDEKAIVLRDFGAQRKFSKTLVPQKEQPAS